MPVHDWTRVNTGTFHDFHSAWITHLRDALNGGLLPRVLHAYVTVPLDATYEAAYRGVAEIWRKVLEGQPPSAT